MDEHPGLKDAAQLFKLLGNPSRLRILRLISDAPSSVQELVAATGLSQPLVSQHLRSLRLGGLAVGERNGREILYSLADHHVAHVVEDALAHVSHNPIAPATDSRTTASEGSR